MIKGCIQCAFKECPWNAQCPIFIISERSVVLATRQVRPINAEKSTKKLIPPLPIHEHLKQSFGLPKVTQKQSTKQSASQSSVTEVEHRPL